MAKFGRESTGEKEDRRDLVVAEVFDRPLPPDELTPRELEIWNAVVGSLRPDWFRGETLDHLANYCRHQAAFEALDCDFAELMELWREGAPADDGGEPNLRHDPSILKQARAIKAMRSDESRMAISWARSLRITIQATKALTTGRDDPNGIGAGVAGEPAPWAIGD